ncbi:MAG: Serine/threonine-protein kinase PknD [Myxococcota bacterium]|nr:Serine/threonine-protein kinase PknD [Myxococcota bacterium]
MNTQRLQNLQFIGPYKVIRPLGAGAIGDVYQCLDEALNKEVAVKLMDAAMSLEEDRAQAFRREAQIVAGLAHPNIAAVYFSGVHDGRPFYAMEFVRGPTLSELIRIHSPMDGDTFLRIAQQLVLALDSARQKGVYHRDVKPGNVVITAMDTVKLLDFGLAEVLTRGRGRETLGFGGTPYYAAPEQIQGERCDHRADIYALGVSFYEMLLGVRPYEGNSPEEVMRKHIVEPVPILSARVPQFPAILSRLCENMMSKSVGERPRTYEDILFQLDQVRLNHPDFVQSGIVWCSQDKANVPSMDGKCPLCGSRLNPDNFLTSFDVQLKGFHGADGPAKTSQYLISYMRKDRAQVEAMIRNMPTMIARGLLYQEARGVQETFHLLGAETQLTAAKGLPKFTNPVVFKSPARTGPKPATGVMPSMPVVSRQASMAGSLRFPAGGTNNAAARKISPLIPLAIVLIAALGGAGWWFFLRKNPDQLMREEFASAHAALDEGRYEDAFSHYDRAAILGGKSSVVKEDIAKSSRDIMRRLVREKNFEQANIVAKLVRGQGVNDADIFRLEGKALMAMNRHKDAVETLEQALMLKPRNNGVMLSLARAAGMAGDLKRARELINILYANMGKDNEVLELIKLFGVELEEKSELQTSHGTIRLTYTGAVPDTLRDTIQMRMKLALDNLMKAVPSGRFEPFSFQIHGNRPWKEHDWEWDQLDPATGPVFVVTGKTLFDDTLAKRLKHQLAQALIINISGPSAPVWLIEGMALHLQDPGLEPYSGPWKDANAHIVSLQVLRSIFAGSTSHPYAQAHGMVTWLVRLGSRERLFQMLALLKGNENEAPQSVSAAFETFYGRSISDMETLHREFAQSGVYKRIELPPIISDAPPSVAPVRK